MGIRQKSGRRDVRQGYLPWLAISLCMALILSLCSQAYSHGPGAWIEGQRLVAEVETHGHSHGPTGHNATDHEHQNAETAEAAESRLAEVFSAPPDRPSASNMPDDIAGDGLRRPPRSVAV